MAISKQFEVHQYTVRNIIHKWKTFKTVANLPRRGHPSKFTPRSDRVMVREIADSPRTTPQTLQASVNMLNHKVHGSTIRKNGTSMACLEGLPRESIFTIKEHGRMA